MASTPSKAYAQVMQLRLEPMSDAALSSQANDILLEVAQGGSFAAARKKIEALRNGSAMSRDLDLQLTECLLAAAMMGKLPPRTAVEFADRVLPFAATHVMAVADSVGAFAGYCYTKREYELGLRYVDEILSLPGWKRLRSKASKERAASLRRLRERLQAKVGG